MSACSISCRFFENFHRGAPILVKTTHKECSICFDRSVSEYRHNFCYRCCPTNSIEYEYHHKNCFKLIPKDKKLSSIPEDKELS